MADVKMSKAISKGVVDLFKKNPAIGCGCGLGLLIFCIFVFFFIQLAFGVENGLELGSVESDRVDITKEEWQAIFEDAEAKMGVPWEFLAAILYNETTGSGTTNFGKCAYYPPPLSGWWVLSDAQVYRSPASEVRETFKGIVSELNYPDNKVVSCNPGGKDSTQNGGAMGYMQIMPYEWIGAKNALKTAQVGNDPLNPWNAQDAAYAGAHVIRNKAGVPDLADTFPTDDASLWKTADCYLGCDNGTTYADRALARYKEFVQRGSL